MIRMRLYKSTATVDGFEAEVVLLDVPLVTGLWKKKDDAALDRLEKILEARTK